MIPKPTQDQCPAFYWNYIKLVPENKDVLGELQVQSMETIDLVTSLDDETLASSYQDGKWTILEILVHLMDCERIFAYRALRIGRKDKTPLPGFNENEFAQNSQANKRKILGIVKEYSLLRASTIELFQSFTTEMWEQIGEANGQAISANCIPYIIAGHELHHRNMIEEKYIGK
ncbi:MAG: DinB family protein [Sphingobacteriales bacterium]|jgi:uncharacterized damage-inducible protein DinB|nr:DinB family protein [Sphingobacteriales bacterium]